VNTAVKVVPLDHVSSPAVGVIVGALNERVPSTLLSLDHLAHGAITRLVASGDFKGERDDVAVVYPTKGPKRVILVGMGKPEEVTRGAVRRAAAIAARRALGMGAETFAVHVAHEFRAGVQPASLGQVLVEGVGQGAWQFRELRAAEGGRRTLKALDIIATRDDRAEIEKGRRVGSAVAIGQKLARNLQALPGNVCTPSYLAEIARQLGRAYNFKVTVLGRPQLEKQGFGALLAVAQGSAQEPQFITLEHRGAGRSQPVCLIGKGITFDSGGISIKPAQSMEDMKYDMSGAAAVLGTFEVLGQLKPPLNVVGVIPSCENLPSGTAYKPGDIVRSLLGKTIEIVNTDAEGRLILADALAYVQRFKPTCAIDLATLTGAIVIALGNTATGLMGNDDGLLEQVRRAGELASERCWPLPLWDEFRELIKSDVADVKNSGGRAAGSITGAWFLREFVDGFPWAHLDIAGTAYTERDQPHLAKGPTGVGVRLLTEFVLGRATG